MIRKTMFATMLGGITGAAALSAGAEPITLKISTASVPSDFHTQALHVFKDAVEKAAPGQFDVQIYDSASLYKAGADVDAVTRGNLQMTYSSLQIISDVLPEYGLLTMPYLFQSPEHYDAFMQSDLGGELRADISETLNMQILSSCYLGTRQLNLRNEMKVETPADLKGVKLRVPDSDAWMFMGEALGAAPTPMPFSDVYLGLQTGTVDAQDNPLSTDYAAKFYEVTKQITLTDHLVAMVDLTIGNQVWDMLTDEQKAVLTAAATEACAWNNAERKADEAKLIDFFKSEGLVITTPDLAAFRSHVQDFYLTSSRASDWKQGWAQLINDMAPATN